MAICHKILHGIQESKFGIVRELHCLWCLRVEKCPPPKKKKRKGNSTIGCPYWCGHAFDPQPYEKWA